jgi:hypothetical protein
MNLEQKLDKALSIAENNQYHSELMTVLNTQANKLKIPMTSIGGMAVAAHGYRRFTNDIDILITKDDATKLATALLNTKQFTNIGQNKLQHKNGSIVNLCVEKVKAGNTIFPPPESNTPGLTVASLPLLLHLKIKANRHKDRTDIIELIKANHLTQEYLNNIALNLRPIERKLLTQLYKIAKQEEKR